MTCWNRIWMCVVLVGSGSALAQQSGGPARITAELVVKVAQRDDAAKALIAETESRGGYFSLLSDEQLVLRVPVAEVEAVVSAVDEQGLVVDRSYNSEDLRETLNEHRTRLAARKRVLDQYFGLLSGADADAVLTVEREITRLVAEVERLEGAIRFMEHGADMANVTVRFRFRERTGPRSDASSSFEWLNGLNLQGLVDDFTVAEDWRTRRNPVGVTAPVGFATYSNRKQFRAASPEGVLFRVTTVEHDPEADLAFWSEAMERRMSGAGYRVIRKEDIDAGGISGHLLELSAPLGVVDYAYAIAVIPSDKQIVVVEAAGEVSEFEARRETIVQSIRAMTW